MRKVLVVSGPSPIFRNLAAQLGQKAEGAVDLFIGLENSVGPLPRIISHRLRKSGLFAGLDQLTMRAIDVFILRFQVERRCRDFSTTVDVEASSINAQAFRDFILANDIDIVVCLGTSIVSEEVLPCPKIGLINVHPGFLPLYRGLGNFWAVANGDWDHVGVSCHWLDAGLDTGQLIWRDKLEQIPKGYWKLNLAAFAKGIDFLAMNLATVTPKPEKISDEQSSVYSWFGLADYLRFIRQMRERKLNNGSSR